MGKKEREAGPRGSLLCPVCKNSVDTIVRGRRKSLGAYVPVWGPGPCGNPDCPEHVADSERVADPEDAADPEHAAGPEPTRTRRDSGG
ncbi:hypothetical protein ACH4SP_00665 [Streptomyces sp. NPDC021093]|uniref:hypothetical protein n=1 Tax=Streptomyces sp. NPDC021093 TaxID=3365112 RepID=UPI0037AEB89A